jgi:vacuolar-type H+-ATPase subunit E/Vma4
VDSKLVSVVRDLESEAERILQEARQQADAIRRESKSGNTRLLDAKQAAAEREAADLLKRSDAGTQAELEQSRARHKAALDTLLHRAEARLEKAAKLILDTLGKA